MHPGTETLIGPSSDGKWFAGEFRIYSVISKIPVNP